VVRSWNVWFPEESEDDSAETGNPQEIRFRRIPVDNDPFIPGNQLLPTNYKILGQGSGQAIQTRWDGFENALARAGREVQRSIQPPHFIGRVLIWNDEKCDFSNAPLQFRFMLKLVENMGQPVTHEDLSEAVYELKDSEQFRDNEVRYRDRIRQLKKRVCKRLNDEGMLGLEAAITSGDQVNALMILR
jgi:hypothetical protein